MPPIAFSSLHSANSNDEAIYYNTGDSMMGTAETKGYKVASVLPSFLPNRLSHVNYHGYRHSHSEVQKESERVPENIKCGHKETE